MPSRSLRLLQHRSRRSRALLAGLAGVLLLLMQALVLQHQLDLDHHHDGEPCELCLLLAPLDHGLVNTLALPQPVLPALPTHSPPLLQRCSEPPTAYRPRAPPASPESTQTE